MLWGKKVLRVTAAIAVAALAAHTAESQKGQGAAQSLVVASAQHLATARHAATGTMANAIPQSASLGPSSGSAMGNLVGITPVAASLPPTAADRCRPSMDLQAAPGAMIWLSLTTPCNRNERIIVRHSGLSFTSRTAPGGTTRLLIPALKSDAMVAVYLSESRLVLGRVSVPDAAHYTRFAVTWEWPAELELRATLGNRVLLASAAALAEETARVMALGAADVQSPIMAHVYSVPGGDLGGVSLSAELRITPASCGRTLRLETVLASNDRIRPEERQVAVPLCGTAGDILLLKNLSPAPKLAAPK